jgi:hypothetical protein
MITEKTDPEKDGQPAYQSDGESSKKKSKTGGLGLLLKELK